jgi:hypothetical protein
MRSREKKVASGLRRSHTDGALVKDASGGDLSELSAPELESRFVAPFYLNMMGINALRLPADMRADVVATGRTVTTGDVRSMLRIGWRPTVMAAWFSLAVPAESVAKELVVAMSRAHGLTGPPLAVAATIVCDGAAVPAMVTYIDFMLDPLRRDGSEGFVAAAIEHLGAEPVVVPSADARSEFRDLREFALALREAFIDRRRA